MGPQGGSSKAQDLKIGNRTVLFYGYVAIVSYAGSLSYMIVIDLFSCVQQVRVRAFSGTSSRSCSGQRKSLLFASSSIIEDVKRMQGGTALIAYYYFDFKDAAKRSVRGLLSSLLFQLADCSDNCWAILSQLHKAYGDGSRQPSNAALSRCLKSMLDISGQVPIFVILDALDECPNDIGTPSARERVLHLVEDLAVSNYANLYMCITSRPEHDIRTVLNPLTPASCRVSLHKEAGQREDINSYIRSFVHTDRAMQRWKREDKELVISTLSKRANGM
jgi:hypothetical protein